MSGPSAKRTTNRSLLSLRARFCVLLVLVAACAGDKAPARGPAPAPENVGVVASALLSQVVFTIPAGKVSANLTNFPVLVKLTSHAGLIANARGDGLDIRFYSDLAGTMLMDFEVESYSAGNLIAWVRVPTVSAASATTFYMRYGDNSSTNFENLNNTWEAGFGAVWHLQENPAAAGSLQDSSGNGRHQTSYALTPTTDSSSLIGNGTLLNQNDEYLSFPDFQTTGTTITISAWWKTPSSLSLAFYNYVSKGAAANDSLMLAGSGTTTFQGRARSAASGATSAMSGNVLVANQWNHLAMVYNGAGTGNSGRLKIYHNGALIAAPTYTGTIPASYVTSVGSLWRIGSTEYNAGYGLMGTADEIHVSSSARSDAWIKAEYDNQVSGSTFFSTTDIPAANGSTCSVAGDCTSGFCVTGFCCPSSCNDSDVCTADSCDSSGVCSNAPGNAGSVCRASTGVCDSAESCPTVWRASNVNAGLWTDYSTAPTWSCTAAGTTIIDTTGTGASCPAVTGDTCGGTATLTHCTNTVSQQSGSTTVMVVRLKGLTVSGGHVIRVKGDKPIVFLVDGNVTVGASGSTIDASSYRSTTAPADGASGPGASTFTCSTGAGGTGQLGNNTDDGGGGGGGGGFGANGGVGGVGDGGYSGTGDGGLAGVAEGSLAPLRPGCRGGTGGAADFAGGAGGLGGGALQITASGTVTINSGGTVKADGAGGATGIITTAGLAAGSAGGGGGSGGAVLIEASSITNNGTVRAFGGGGAGSAGGDSGATVGQNGIDGGAGGAGGAGNHPGHAGGAGGSAGAGVAGTSTPSGSSGYYESAGGGGGGGGRTTTQALPSSGPAAGGVCPPDVVAASGTLCRATTGVCDVQETCTGTSGVCPTDAYLSNATSCRGTAGECDLVELCTGTAVACPTDVKKTNGTACTSDGNACTVDQCNGTNVACVYTTASAGTTCRASVDVCDVTETCTGTSTTCPTNVFVAMGTSCRGTAGECDLAETCTGTVGTCPADAKRSNGTACTTDSNVCTVDQCDGSAATCQHPAGNAGTLCNATTGVCDVAELCTGTSTSCPGNVYAASSVVCRATVGECDAAENCTGVSATCPATDAKRAAGSACTADAVTCSADICDGTTNVCQHPAGNAGLTCRATGGACDAAEACTGTSTTCPSDILTPAGVTCRATAGTCDFAEVCTGTSNACPSDSVQSSAVVCRASAGFCDVAPENCTGSTGACPADTYKSSAITCRATAGVCDLVEMCTGSAAACPADAMSTAVCRATTGVCDAAEVCTGTAAACPADIVASSSTPCRFQSNICDAVDFCTGASGTCPADSYAPMGTDCGYTTGATTIYSTGLPASMPPLINAGYTVPTLTNAGPTSAWSDALRFPSVLPATSGSNQYLYQSFSTAARKFQAYDLVEYDVYLASPQASIGGLDVEAGAVTLRDQGINDQLGIGSHPTSNIVSNAYGTWYHRRYPLGNSALVNATSTYWSVADENDAAHAAYTAYYDNVIVAAKGGECNGANACLVATAYACTAPGDCASNVCNAVTLNSFIAHRFPLDTNMVANVGGQTGGTSGTVTWSGGAAVLTGASTTGPYLTFPGAVMSGLTDVTFEVWFSIDAHATWQRILDFGNDTTEYIFIADQFDATNIPRIAYKRDNGTEVSFNATSAFPTGTLTHVALSVDGATSMTLYINGTASGSVALGGSDTLAAITFDQNYIGQSQYTGDTDLDGRIYDFRIYNKALSAAEVLATYKKGVDSKVCIAQYPLGSSCIDGSECLSTFCVDGRCCNTACDSGDTSNCQACSTLAGAAVNGTCGNITAGTVCRPTVDVTCDLAETCTGTSTACPLDNQ